MASPEEINILFGDVEDHPKLGTLRDVSTSSILSIEGKVVTTFNTIYVLLGPPNKHYDKFMKTEGFTLKDCEGTRHADT